MASASMISMAAGTSPAAMIEDTAAPPAPVSSKAARSVWTTSGAGVSRTVTLVTMPSVPSDPTNAPIRS